MSAADNFTQSAKPYKSVLYVFKFETFYCGMGLYFVTCLDTKHIT